MNVFERVEKADIPFKDDDYTVKVRLKDETFAYSPRRFAYNKKLQIREITDDLLSRNIIKVSTSPYCARVVLVKKKNDKTIVDLRPLNERVMKQKYPFLIIKDCLAHLGNKSIFTLLDLKNGFHQIKIHPNHIKYFSFVTPNGQLEHYNFQLNLQKCSFPKTTIEYPGYIISPTGITISSRHTEAIARLLQPKKVLELPRFLDFTNYYRKFLKDYASISKPLNLLLRNTLNKVNVNLRIAYWTHEIVHREGHRMAHIDALNRIVVVTQAILLKRKLQYKQLQDPKFRDPSIKFKRKDHYKFELLDGLNFRKGPNKFRFTVPDSMVNSIIRVYYYQMTHCDLKRTIKGITANRSLLSRKNCDTT